MRPPKPGPRIKGVKSSIFSRTKQNDQNKNGKGRYDYGNDWKEISKKVRSLSNYTCSECGWRPKQKVNRSYLHAHHKRSVSRGGSNSLSNLEVECLSCHASDHPHMQKWKTVAFFKANKNWL